MAHTHIEWRIDEPDGQPFQRFARSRHVEVWLVARERADDPEREAGSRILHADGGSHPAAIYLMAFQFEPSQIPSVERALAVVRNELAFGGRPSIHSINDLILLSSPTSERQVPHAHREPPLVERMIAERAPHNTWRGRLFSRAPKGD